MDNEMKERTNILVDISNDWRDENCGYRWLLWLTPVWCGWLALTFGGIYLYLGIRTSWTFTDLSQARQFCDNLAVPLESLGPWILFSVLLAYVVKTVITRNISYIVMSGFATCLLLREIHWNTGIKQIIFPLLGLCLLWLFLWRDIIDKPRKNKLHTILFLGAITLYAFCQIIEKRVLRGILPLEPQIHTGLEELSETVSHLFLMSAALFGDWSKRVIASKPKDK